MKLIIRGGKPLKGTIIVRGAKNATTPILAATLLTKDECIINNIPLASDVLRMLKIMQSIGAKINWLGKRKISIKTQNVNSANLDESGISKMRSSILFIGSLLARTGYLAIQHPGGCQIGARPIDTHLSALKTLGASIRKTKNKYFINATCLKGADIVMNEFSVTATENAILASVLAKGNTTINCAASDVYVQDLCRFLNKMGAKISGIGTHTIKIKGVKNLRGANHSIIPDPIEMGTFICLGAATKSRIIIKNFRPEFLKIELSKYKQANINFKVKKNQIKVSPSLRLKATNAHNMPHPGFTADLLQQFGVLMTQADGTSLIHDWMYEDRMRYTNDLNKMGANCTLCDPHRVLITGPTQLYGQEVVSYDLRSGASMVIAALVARGQSIIHDADQIERGYENLTQRLQNLGADIKEKNENAKKYKTKKIF